MANDRSIHASDDNATAVPAGIDAAYAQVVAARLRREALIASGQLLGSSADPSALLPTKDFPGYTLLREIHRGGQGVVYQALQQSTNRKVAIKVLLEGAYASKSARQRFEREIELVASLRHPNVISVFHSDQTADGLRFCVMDYVRGLPLTHYVRQNQLTLEQALKLFAQVCEAVNHAHQKGVIHRDLKPSNILVDVEGVPRVLDFGLAKLMGGAEESLVSMTGQVVGTLPYMSPEQTRGNPDEIDTRTDVYALGVLLYEMLTGQYPYPVAGRMADVLKHIAETEPTPPSRAWTPESGILGGKPSSRIRHFVYSSLRRSVASPIDDEVQTIVLKALAKERERRYQSAGEPARDIENYLTGKPIEAKRDSALYVLGKQLRRHKASVAVGSGFLLLLAVCLVVSLTLWRGASAARDAESGQRARAAAVSTFLAEMLTAADPAKAKGEKLTVREALDAAAKRIEERAIQDQPLVEADVRFTIGSTYFGLGLYPQAETQLRAADALQSRELGEEHPDTLRTRSKLAHVLTAESEYAGAAALAQPTFEAQRRVLGPDHPDTLQSMVVLGCALSSVGRFAEAESLVRSAIDRRARVLGENHPDTADAMNWLGAAYMFHTYPEKAEPLHREALRIHTQALGEKHPASLFSMHGLAGSLLNQSRPQEAEAIIRRLLELSLVMLGPEHMETIGRQLNLAHCLAAQGRQKEAEPMYREYLTALVRTVGPTHSETITGWRFLANSLATQRKYPEAETLLREALDAAVEKYGPEHGDTSIRLMCALADVLAKQRKDPEAEQVARQVLEYQRRQLPRPWFIEVNQSSSALIEVLQRRGANDEALLVEQELIESLLAAADQPNASAETLNSAARKLLYPANETLRDAPQALELALQASKLSGPQNSRYLRTLARAYMLTGDLARATQVWEQASALLPDDQSRARMLYNEARELLTVTPETLRNPAEALPLALRANELSEYKNLEYVEMLAWAYQVTGDPERAAQVWKQAIALSPDDHSLLNRAARNLLTVTPQTLRASAEALEFGLRANELSDYKNSDYLDLLASVYFRTGDTPKAIEFEKQAMDLLPQDASQRSEYASRRAQFEAALETAPSKDTVP